MEKSKDIESLIKLIEMNFENNKVTDEYIKASNVFNELISHGLVKERGNNLLSPSDDNQKFNIEFNSSTHPTS